MPAGGAFISYNGNSANDRAKAVMGNMDGASIFEFINRIVGRCLVRYPYFISYANLFTKGDLAWRTREVWRVHVGIT
jgi:hypothetical protein